VLPFALRARTTVRASPREDGRLVMRSEQQAGAAEAPIGELDAVEGWARYVAGAARVLGVERGFDVAVASTVPSGAGLSSSAALCVAALGALSDAALDPLEHARLAQRIEHDLGAPVGLMDQLASVFGVAGHALLIDCRSDVVEPLPFDPAAAGLVLLVMDTRAEHEVGEGPYAERRESCEAAARTLGVAALRDASVADLDRLDGLERRRAEHVVREDERVLAAAARLREGDLRGLGPLLSESHASMRDLFEISTPELDAVCEAAEGAGALGARMTGGGFGGSAIALVETGAEPDVRAAAQAALAQVEIFAAEPADGARRVDG